MITLDLIELYNMIIAINYDLFDSILYVISVIAKDIAEIYVLQIIIRILSISACVYFIRHSKYERFRFFAHYFLAYVISATFLIACYIFLCVYHTSNQALSVFDLFVMLSIFRIYINRIVRVGMSLHDWSVGIPINTEFAQMIAHAISVLLFGISIVGPLYRAFAIAKCINLIVSIIFFSPFYIYIAIFLTHHQQQIQNEVNEVIPDFIFDRNILFVVYGGLISFFLLNIVDTGIEDRFVRIMVTFFLIVGFLAVIDVYLRITVVKMWSGFAAINYNNGYYNTFIILRSLLLVIFAFIMQYIWNISDTIHLVQISESILTFIMRIGTLMLLLEFATFCVASYIVPNNIDISAFHFENAKQRAITLFAAFQGLITMMKGVGISGLCLIGIGVDISSVISNVSWILASLFYVGQAEFQNIFSGIALVIEDAISIGDLVQIDNNIFGNIEHIGLRSLRIRTLDGSVFFVPFGKITVLQNKSRDFSFVLLNIAVVPQTEEKVVVESINTALHLIKPEMDRDGIRLGEVEHRGVIDVSNERVVYQARIKCSPGKQYNAKRALNMVLQQVFKRNNIIMPSQVNISTHGTSMSNAALPTIL